MNLPDGFVPDEVPADFVPDKLPADFVPDKAGPDGFVPDKLSLLRQRVAADSGAAIKADEAARDKSAEARSAFAGGVADVAKGAANTAGFVASISNAGAGMALGRPWPEVKAQWQRVHEMGEQAPLEEISNTLGVATMIYGGYEGLKAAPMLLRLANNSDLMNKVRKIYIPERGMSTVPDAQVFEFYKAAPEEVKKEMATYNPQLRNILLDPAKVERFSNAAPRATAAAPEVPAAMAATAPAATEPPSMPRPAHNSFEGTVLEFKIKQAIGLKPADALTPDKMAVAYEVGALPQELAEQAGLPAALEFAAQERAKATAKAAGPGAAQVPAEDVIADVVARKQAEGLAAQKEAISAPHPEMGKPAYAMSEAEFTQAVRKANPEASGTDIAKAYEQVMAAAQDHKLVDGVELARMNDSALQAEADLALTEPAAFDMTEPSGSAAPVPAMTLEEARAKFPNLTEAQHKAMVKDAVDAYQVMPDEVPKGYEDVQQYATDKHATEQRAAFAQDEVQRQIQEQGHATPILNMLGRNKLNAKKAEPFFGGEIHKDDMRGYLSTTGGLSVDEATERAWSNGWIPDNDIDQFTEALQAEVRKKNVIADEGLSGEVLGRMGAEPEVRPGYLETPESYKPEVKPPFYSKLTQTIEQKMSGPMGAAQLRALVKNAAVKQDELDWYDLDGFLKDNPKPTKAQVLDYLAANALEIKEVVKGNNKNDVVDMGQGTITKFGKYQLPGGENYREVLFTLPQKGYTDEDLNIEIAETKDRHPEWSKDTVLFAAKRNLQGRPQGFTSPHWSEPNVIAHLRLNDRTIDGKRTLFVEEVQSDWHQKGREVGYKFDSPESDKIVQEWFDKEPRKHRGEVIDSLRFVDRGMMNEWNAPEEIKAAFETYLKRPTDQVPDAPLKKSWPEFVMKRAIRMAAEQGYDAVAWTNGAQQAVRYDLSKHIDQVAYSYDKDAKTWDISASKNDNELIAKSDVTEAELPDVIGKELANKIVAGEGKKGVGFKTLSGLDLKVGGSGMVAFYDQIIPSFVSKFTKKWGGKVVDVQMSVQKEINNPIFDIPVDAQDKIKREVRREAHFQGLTQDGSDEDAEKYMEYVTGREHELAAIWVELNEIPAEQSVVHSLAITPELRKAAVTEGFPLFSPGHVYQPGEPLAAESEAMAPAALQRAVRDVRTVAPAGQWHDLRLDKVIDAVEADFKARGVSGFVGKKIDTIQDVAELAAMGRHPTIEHLMVIKVKNGKVSGSLNLTSGKIGYVDPEEKVIQDFVADADEFYMSHNHPTGNATPSEDDINSTKMIASDKRFKGHVVTDHVTYTAILPDGTAIAQRYRGEKQSFRADIEKMAHAPAVVGWARGVLQGDNLGLMFVDAQKQVMSFDQIAPGSDFNAYAQRHAHAYGAQSVFLVAGDSAVAKMKPGILRGNYNDLLVLKADGSYASARMGAVPGFKVFTSGGEGVFKVSSYAETPADYNPEDYNKVVGRWKPGMKLTLRARMVVPQFPKGLPKGSEAALVDVDVKTGELLADFGGKLLVVTPNMFKETFRVPGSPQPGQKERKFIDSVRGMEKTAPEVKDTIAGNYDTISNEVTLEEAKAAISRDPEKARRMVYETGEPTRLSNTVAMLFIDDLQKQGRFGEAVDLIEHTAKRNTSAGQAIQALAMYRRLTPEGILRYAEKVVSKGQVGMERFVSELKGLTDEAARVVFAKKHGLPYLSVAKAGELYDAAVAVAKMPEGRERDLATGKMLQQVADLLPKGFWDKVSGLQILAQLLNPKTFIRNIIGNAAFMAFENFSQATGVPLDLLVGTMSGRRTTAMPGLMTQVRGFAHGLKDGTEEALSGVDIKAINNKFDLPRGFTFDSAFMRALEKTLNVSLKATDRAFYQAAVEDSLRVAMKAGRVDAPTPEMLAQAHLDGLYRTFNDENALRAALVRTKRVFNFGKGWGMGDMVIKYPGTPASILMRGIEYSPFGFMQATYTLAKAAARGNFDADAQREFVRQSSRAMTGGIGLVGVGVILSALGIITGRREDKRAVRETEAAIGVRDYQINVSGLLRFAASGMDPDAAKMRAGDMLVSYDWMQPAAIGLAMGANIEKGLEKSGTVELSDAIQSGVKTLTEQPLLQGIQRFFMGGDIVKGTVQSVKDVPASFVPTLLNQVKQLVDNTSRTVQDNDALDAMSKQIRNKIPFASDGLAPRVDVLGRVRKMYQNDTNNPFNVLLNPAFVARYQPTPTTDMVLEIWARTGDTIQLPRVAPKKVKVRGVDRELTDMEQAVFQHYIGERTSLVFDGLAQNADFMAQPDHVKAKYLQGIMTDIYQSARVNVLEVPPK